MGNVLVLAEHRQGALRDITFEMLAVAPAAARDLGGEVVVLLLGSGVDGMAQKIAGYGVKVLVVDDPLFENFNADKYQQVFSVVIDEQKPALVMIGQTAQGVDIAPALAVQKNLPFVADVIGLGLEDGTLKATRQLYSGKVNAVVAFKPAGTYLVTADLREADLSRADLRGATYSTLSVMQASWHAVSDAFCTELMRWDASANPDLAGFDRWAGGSDQCPCIKHPRIFYFNERRDLWQPGPPTMTLWQLWEALAAEKEIKI